MTQLILFIPEEKKPVSTCRYCIHKTISRYPSKVFYYCGIRKSNLTGNGKLKIKNSTPSCSSFEEKI